MKAELRNPAFGLHQSVIKIITVFFGGVYSTFLILTIAFFISLEDKGTEKVLSLVIEVFNLTKQFGRNVALKGISFQIPKGEICGLLGPNGAGKSTTLKILSSFWKPDAGSATLCGWDVALNPLEARRQIGYVPETPILYKEMSVKGYLQFVADLKEVPKKTVSGHLEAVAEQCGLTPAWHKPLGSVSKGYRQRTALAQALIGDPPILLLDEPTSALDPLQVMEIRDVIRSLAKNRTILFCTHILQEVASCCQRVLILNHGNLVANQPIGLSTEGLENLFSKVILNS